MKLQNVEQFYNIDSGSYIFSDFYEKSAEKVALILKSNNRTKNSKNVIASLLETFQKEYYTKKGTIEKRIEQTFLDLHWKVASIFHQQKNKFNISALLLVVKNNKLYVVQAGRLCVVIFQQQAKFVGLGVKQLIDIDEPLNVLGAEDETVTYKVFSHKLKPGTQIVALSVFSAQKLGEAETESEFNNFLNKLTKEEIYPLFKFSLLRKKKIKSTFLFSLTTLFSFRVLALVVILASFYGLLGKKWIQGWISSGKEFVDEKKVQNININRILSSDQELQFTTAHKLPQLNIITKKPYFDTSHLFLIIKNKIVTVHKNDYKLSWEKEMNNEIVFVKLLRNNMMFLVDNKGVQFLLNRTNGVLIWQKETNLDIDYKKGKQLDLIVLDYIKDSRLNKNYYVTAVDSVLRIYSANSGEVVNEKQFTDAIDYISDYDYIKKCFYLVMNNEIVKLKLDIK